MTPKELRAKADKLENLMDEGERLAKAIFCCNPELNENFEHVRCGVYVQQGNCFDGAEVSFPIAHAVPMLKVRLDEVQKEIGELSDEQVNA